MEIVWNSIKIEDEQLFRKYYEKEQSRSCEHCFTNNILWAPFYDIRYAIIEDCLVFAFEKDQSVFSYPIGKGNIQDAIETLLAYTTEREIEFVLCMVTSKQFENLITLFPELFEITYNRDVADYIYESEKLISLSGKKLHGKRNHINNFLKNYPEFQYEKITEKNIDDCYQVAERWKKDNRCENNSEKHQEFCVTKHALSQFSQLNLTGGLIRIDGVAIAFCLGEPLSKDTYVVHVEKADANIQGAYPMINQQFVLHEAKEYKYINREEDTGAEGLRKAKLSYYPAFLQEKGVVRVQHLK